jgi:uncharacterized protein
VSGTALIVALSARALAQSAARAGFEVHTIDLFADLDTVEVASSTSIVRAAGNAFEEAPLRCTLDRLRQRVAPDLLVPGSGFESRPVQLEVLTKCFPSARFCGNTASVVAGVKDPIALGASMKEEGIPCPASLRSGIIDGDGWLLKATGASGGAHVRGARAGEPIEDGWHAQRVVAGQSMSALFLGAAAGGAVQLLGVCEHWQAQPECPGEFRHSGLVTVMPDADLKATLHHWGDRIGARCRLSGLWGIDFIRAADGRCTLIEINPRPTASVELFEGADSLFAAHVKAYSRPAPDAPIRLAPGAQSAASAVFYAPGDVAIPAPFAWPSWAFDRPRGGTQLAAGDPVCTVLQRSDTPQRAVMLACGCLEVLRQALVADACRADVI